MLIKSVYENQSDILDAIEHLYCPKGFMCDITYGNGSFYKNRKKPTFRFDIDRSLSDVSYASSDDLPIPDGLVSNVMFDPPFLTYIKNGRGHDSIMGKRFGGYWSYDELEMHYKNTFKEVHRVLENDGIFIIKCQDIIHNHQLYVTHANVINWCYFFKLRPLDIFVLAAKHRIPVSKHEQQHARIYHSYFLVFKKDKKMKGLNF